MVLVLLLSPKIQTVLGKLKYVKGPKYITLISTEEQHDTISLLRLGTTPEPRQVHQGS